MNDESDRSPLDHGAVEAHGLIERYHQGTLAAEEEERFEAHFMECAACQEELDVHRSFVRGMKALAAEEAVRSTVRIGLLAWLARHRAATGLAAFSVLAVGLALGHSWRKNELLETRVAELTAAGGGASGELAAPLVGVPVVLLGVLRGEDGPPSTVTDSGGPYSLAIDVGADPRFVSYSVDVLDAAGEVRFERSELLPNDLEVIQLTFPADFLPPGEYRLVAHGTLPDGGSVEIGSYPFRVTTAG